MSNENDIPQIDHVEPVSSDKEKPKDPNLGRVLKQTYTLVKKVGEGGMGDVYKALQSPLNREVAIKLLKPSDNNPDGEHYFMREVQAINMLRHPNIIQIVDFGKEDDGTLYLVMEYLPGQTLKRVIRKEYPLDPKRICGICIQVLSALEQAHKSHIVHCDLKPANLMIEEVAGQNDFIKVLDFGIAKVKGPAMEVGPYTQAGNIVGTFDYMSPEQIMRKDLDGRADIWSLGVIMYEMLTKKRLFHDKDAVSIIGRVMQMPIKPPIEVAGDKANIPQGLNDIVMKAMQRNADKRFKDAADMRQALQQLLSQLESGNYHGNSGSYPAAGLGSEDSSVHSRSGSHSGSLANSGLLRNSGPHSFLGNSSGHTSASSVLSRSGGFGALPQTTGRISDSQRMATGIAAGTSVLDQTFSIDALQDSLLGERRKVAVLAIQQRARRSKGIDPEELAMRSRQEAQIIKEIVVKHGGEIDSFLGGTYTILFGATRARVGDNIRALECAKALSERFKLLDQGFAHLGIALCYGEVFVSSRQGGNAYGEAIDRCVEVARSTKDAKVLVDSSMVSITRKGATFDAPVQVSGEDVQELLSVSADAASQQQEEEVTELREANVYVPRPLYYDELVRRSRSVADGQGGGVGIVGEAGVGKSTLIEQFAKGREQAGWQVFRVNQAMLNNTVQMAAVRAWIRQIAGTYEDPRVLVRKACESIGLRDRVEGATRFFADEDGDKLSPAQLPFQDQNALAYFTAALFHRMVRFAMKKGPVLFVFDGADARDQLSMEFFDSFLSQITRFKVMLLLTVRLDVGVVDHGLPGNFEALVMHGFEPEEARQYVSQLLGFTPPLPVLDQLYDRSSGNPMFLKELLRALLKAGGAQALSDVNQVVGADIPLSLQELLAQRVDELPDNLRDLMAIASVLGESFREEFLYQVTPAHLGAKLVIKDVLAVGLFEARQDAFGRVLVGFNPRALRTVVYERIPRQTRQQIHLSVIEFLEQASHLAAVDAIDVPLMLAFHYRSVDGFEGAAYYLVEVGNMLLDLYDYAGAVDQFREALSLLEGKTPVTHPTALLARTRLLTALRESGRLEEAQREVEKLPPTEEIPEENQLELFIEIGSLGIESGTLGKATETLFAAVDKARAQQNIKLEVKALLALSQLFEKENQLQRSINLLVEVSQKVELIGDLDMKDPDDRRLSWTAYNQLGTLFLRQKQIQQALNYFQQAMQRSQQIQDHRGLMRVVSNMGALFLNVRDVPNALKYFEQALALAKATGDLLNQARILTNMGITTMEANQLEESKKHFKQARSIAEEIGWYEGLADLAQHIKRLRQLLNV